MKKLTSVISVLFLVILCLLSSACENNSNSHSGQFQDNSKIIEEKIESVLANTPACDGWAPSVVEMINTVFYSYKWDFEAYDESETSYIAKFTGNYSPNPDIPNISLTGSISYLVDVKNGQASIFSDPNNIYSIFMIYIFN